MAICLLFEYILQLNCLWQTIIDLAGWTIKLILLTDPQDVTRLSIYVFVIFCRSNQNNYIIIVLFFLQFNFVGRILGPRGMTAKQLEQETGCKIMVRGKGSMRDKKKVSFFVLKTLDIYFRWHFCKMYVLMCHVVCFLTRKHTFLDYLIMILNATQICCFTYI